MSQSSLNKKHLSYITFLQSFAVLLVCLGHSLPFHNMTGELPLIPKLISDILYSFHMPLFFAIGGFLFFYSINRHDYIINFKTFFTKKLKRLMIPYFTIGTIAYFLKTYIFNSFAYRPSQPTLSFYIMSMLAPSNNPDKYLWFLPVIFAIFIIAYLAAKKIKIINLLIISFLLTFTVKYIPLHFLKITINNFLYFIFGGCIYIYKDILFKFFNKWSFFIFSFLTFLILFLYAGKVSIIKILVAIFGIIFSFSFAIILDSKNKKFLYGILDGKYYQIYLLSWFAQTGLRCLYQANITNYYLTVVLMFVGGIVFSLVLRELISKYTPNLKIFIGM